MKNLRYSIDDLLEGLRLKDVFDLSEVKYAYVETNGSLSVELKDEHRPVTPKDLKLPVKSTPLPCLVISDGKIVEDDFALCAMTKKKIESALKKAKLEVLGKYISFILVISHTCHFLLFPFP